MALRVGITGGIGSGKSTVAAIFGTLGIPVYNADDAAKRLMNDDPDLKDQLIKHFGTTSYKDGKLDRAYLAAAVFNDEEKLNQLNALVHPATIADGEKWMKQQIAAYAIKEAAIIFESGTQRYLDYIIGVYAPPTLRLHRTMKRSNMSAEEAKARIAKQMDDAIKMKLCDWVITNDELQPLIPQVMKIHQSLLLMGNR